MGYVKKVCPVCGREFFVLESVAEKAVYCTLECLERGQGDPGVRESFLVAGK
ncbi:hypothetical protein ACSAZK_09235 [Methanosarcina sp. Mfa9]|uniref:hypothetical protein n=1 Tax=Methanosarcina sp. Mfa9 TaxID=3439063 RepID=UPI003F853BBA